LPLILIGNPYNDPNIRGDAYRTLFVSNLSFSTDERTLRESFEAFGRIRNIKIPVD
jgi:U1 small nuclear ribonucleoprotein 70kDa